MEKQYDYIILQSKTRKGLREKVTALLADNWECQGGIAKDGEMYIQAVILRKQD